VITWVFDEDSFSPVAKLRADKKYSILSDYLGTPTHVFNDGGEVIWEAALDSYGKLRVEKGTLGSCPFRYQGQYEDFETGLYYNRFRYYSPEEGSYISQDPIRLNGGSALYSYVANPNAWLDILGLSTYTGKKRGPKTKDEGGPHNDTIERVAKKLEADGWKITQGGNREKEVLHRTGGKKDRRPDIVATKGKETKVINVGKKDKSGSPIKREKEAIADLENVYGKGKIDFEPYN
jgi:RHS repeat-associated protein